MTFSSSKFICFSLWGLHFKLRNIPDFVVPRGLKTLKQSGIFFLKKLTDLVLLFFSCRISENACVFQILCFSLKLTFLDYCLHIKPTKQTKKVEMQKMFCLKPMLNKSLILCVLACVRLLMHHHPLWCRGSRFDGVCKKRATPDPCVYT